MKQPTDSAKRLKKSLGAKFPTVRFSVTIRNYDTCTVGWTDGPTTQAVTEFMGAAEGKGFDGMTDSTYCKREAVLPDGTPSSLGYLFTSRTISPTLARRCAEQVAAYWGGCDPIPDITATSGAGFDMKSGTQNIRPGVDLDWFNAIHQAAGDASKFRREPLAVVPA